MLRLFVVGFFVALIAAGATTYSTSQAVHPLVYADLVSRHFSAGDNDDRSGWSECKETQAPAPTVAVLCEGTRSIRNDSGQMFHVNYFCEFEFTPKANGDFQVTHNLCQ